MYITASGMGWIPDYRGIHRAEAVMGRNGGSIEVAAGLAVQGEFSGIVDNGVGSVKTFITGEASSAYGLAQTNADEISKLGLGNLDPQNPADAVKVMQARIRAAQGACDPSICSDTDRLIIAALAQNRNMYPGDVSNLVKEAKETNGGNINWTKYFSESHTPGQIDAQIRQKLTGMTYEKGFMLLKYILDIRELYRRGWELPDGITEKILDDLEKLARGE